MSDRDELGWDADLAIERALEAANLRAGGSPSTSTAEVAADHEPSAAEAGDIASGPDAD
jgi:hypothetical protein